MKIEIPVPKAWGLFFSKLICKRKKWKRTFKWRRKRNFKRINKIKNKSADEAGVHNIRFFE